ncbi:MAG: heavy-metal-associated domain-containing protein [Bacteroidia bacterium]|nr:heavy-metal-associated domain-containing protein [Bacteroidia bacterium]
MKNLRILFIAFLSVAFLLTLNNKVFAGNDKEIKIKTEFHCANGKATIEKEMAKVDGVKSVVADLETKVVTIKYDPAKQDKDKLAAALEKIGYKNEFTKPGTKVKSACSHGEEGKK